MCDIFQRKAKEIIECLNYLYPEEKFDEATIEQVLRNNGPSLSKCLGYGILLMLNQRIQSAKLQNQNPND